MVTASFSKIELALLIDIIDSQVVPAEVVKQLRFKLMRLLIGELNGS